MKTLSSNDNNLTRRYLVWCYKTAKEDLDRVDRYFTQFVADNFILKKLKRKSSGGEYTKLVNEFENYLRKKKANADKQKFSDKKLTKLKGDYQYLQNRFAVVEEAIIHFLGKKSLKEICDAYEQEMTQRILSAREHT